MAQGSVMGREVAQHARMAGGQARPWLERLARVGYAAKGVVYVLVGFLALRAAAGAGGETTDTSGALRSLGDSPLAQALLVIVGIGLLGYALWQLLAAITDAEGEGSDGKGIAKRVFRAGRGLLYGALGVEALRLVAGSQGRSGDSTESWTARALEAPFGRWLVIAAGAGIALYALYQAKRAASGRVRENLDLSDLDADTERYVVMVARFGIAARAVVFLLTAWFLVRAALEYDPSEAGGLEQSLRTLAQQPYGPILLGLVALGLMAYGVFQFVKARYRHLPAI